MKGAIVICLMFFVSFARGQSSDEAYQLASPLHAGARMSYLRNFHQSTEEIIPGCVQCGDFSNGSGGGFLAQLFGEIPFNFYRRLDLTFGAGFAARGGAAGSSETDYLTVKDPISGNYVPFNRLNSFTLSLNYIDFSAGLHLKPIARIPAYFAVSLDADIPAGHSATYQQTEQILSPQGVTYPETGTTSRVDGTVAINGLSTLFGVTGAIGYEVPIGHSLSIAPELSYFYPINAAQSGFPWHVSSLSFGVAVRWNEPGVYVPPPPPPVQTKPSPPPVLAHEDPNAFAPKLSVIPMASAPFHIIETTVTETFPILPYIFFDSASAVIPDRYARMSSEEVTRFKENELPHRSLESYYQLMNVIGSRMQSNPDAMLAINGTTDGREGKDESGGMRDEEKDLAKRRATAIRDYFVNVWHIDSERFNITTTDVPEHPSSTEFAEGFEENRRVELSSDDDKILKPIVHERFKEESAIPKVVPVKLSATSSIGVRDWKMIVKSHGVEIFESSGEGNPPPSIEWKPTDGQVEQMAKSLKLNDSLSVDFEASAVNGAHSEEIVGIPASKSINPFELSRLSLIVFDFDQSAIDKQNRRMISQFTGKSFYPASKASIIGSTDNLGELKHNQTLSEARAFNVRDLILSDKPSAQITSTKGIGPSDLLYDNHLPEGRYYCRTVRVEVETPLDSIIEGQ